MSLDKNNKPSSKRKKILNQEPINLLLIEDNPDDIFIIKQLLENVDHFSVKILSAETFKQGLNYISENVIHVILLDLNLPDKQGIETYLDLRKHTKNIPIIIMSAITDKELIYQAIQKGAQAYFVKGNVEAESLVRVIRYAIWSFHSQ